MTQIDKLVKMLRVTTERMANVCSVNMETWNEHSNAALSCADALEAQAAENARLKERLGPYGLVVVEFNGVGHYVSEAVAARIATLERVIAWANNSLFGSHSFFLSLNGGEDKEHHLDTAIEKLKEQTRNYWSRIANLEAQLKSFREALDNATSRARMNDSDGAQVSVDNYHLKNGRRILMSALRNAEGEKNGEPSGD